MAKITILMECQLNENAYENIGRLCDNFYENYPEFSCEESSYRELPNNVYRFNWIGAVGDEYADEIIRLTHHAEAIYEETEAEHVHVEVCVDGTWYGKPDSAADKALESVDKGLDSHFGPYEFSEILHTLRECSRDWKYEGTIDHMMAFVSELTGVSQDALMDRM